MDDRLDLNVSEYNRHAWDGLVESGDRWTKPFTPEAIARARKGDWEIVLTPTKPVPRAWFPPIPGLRVLCLAGAGGQQASILAAAGASVTVFDNSPRQLAQDRFVADRDDLELATVQGDMRDLGAFPDQVFDLVFNPCSVGFVPDVRPVWREVFRVLRPGGVFMAGFIDPASFIFDETLADRGELVVRHRLPYSDLKSLTGEERAALEQAGKPLIFSHSLEDMLGGQIDAGFVLTGFYDDAWPDKGVSKFFPGFMATRATKPPGSVK
jgi:SAM-dependent methyltransferase